MRKLCLCSELTGPYFHFDPNLQVEQIHTDGEAYNIILCYVCRGGFSDLELCTPRLCACVRLSGLISIFCSLLHWSPMLHMLHYVLQVLSCAEVVTHS